MGRYLGIRAGGRLIAMAGERLQLDGATEISAVCTHPDFQGHGYARTLMAALIADAAEQGRQPFLHVKSENGAKRLYEKLGFAVSRVIHLTLIASTEARSRAPQSAPPLTQAVAQRRQHAAVEAWSPPRRCNRRGPGSAGGSSRHTPHRRAAKSRPRP